MNTEMDNKRIQEIDPSLFRFVGNDTISSEKIIAPRYSYWRSVFRVFFKRKLNIFLIFMFVLIMLSSFLMPSLCPYDQFEHVTNPAPSNHPHYHGRCTEVLWRILSHVAVRDRLRGQLDILWHIRFCKDLVAAGNNLRGDKYDRRYNNGRHMGLLQEV